MITLNNKFRKFLDKVNEINPCIEALDWMNNRDADEITLQEAIDIYMNDSTALEGWAHWVAMNMAAELDEDALLAFIERIEDPMLARRLERASKYLKEKHKKKLKEKWVGKIGDVE